MRRGRRSRSRGESSLWLALLVAAVLAATVGAVTTTPTDAVTTGTLSRGSTASVADDANGLLGLDVAGGVTAGSDSRLVTVTNRLDRTVTLTVDATAGSLSNGQATLAAGESVVTGVTVGCQSPPETVTFTVRATGGSQFTGTATRSATVDTAGCRQSPSFASIRLDDTSTPNRGGKAEYALQYVVDARQSSFERVTVTFENLDRTETDSRGSTTQNGNLQFESGGQRFGETYSITIRLFGPDGEARSERITVTDVADGSGTVYQAP